MAKKGLENKRHRDEEPDLTGKKWQWRFPLGPGKVLLTLLCICILGFSLSPDVAWLIGYQYTVYFLYVGVFSTTLMLLIDLSSLVDYFKNRRKGKINTETSKEDSDTQDLEQDDVTTQTQEKEPAGMKMRYQRLRGQRYGGKQNVILMPKKMRDELITLHEGFYPEDRNLTEKFMEKFRKDTTYDFSEDIDNIKYIIYTAESCYRTVILNSLPYIRLEQFKKGFQRKTEQYNSYSNRISIKLSNLKEMDKEANPYGVFFHELSHAVDDVSCMDIFLKVRHSVEHYTNEAGEKLQDIARREVKCFVAASIHEIVAKKKLNVTEEQERMILEVLFTRVTEYYKFDHEDMDIVLQELQNEYGYSEFDKEKKVRRAHFGKEHPLYQKKYHAVSDVLGGYTGNTIGGAPIGHYAPLYWYNLLGMETKRQGRELWAEYSSYLITGNKECMAGTEQYFPESCAFIRHLWKDEIGSVFEKNERK